jgi:hypothetical protein
MIGRYRAPGQEPGQELVDASPARRPIEVLGRSARGLDSSPPLRPPKSPYLLAAPPSNSELRERREVRSRPPGRSLRRLTLILGAGALVIVLVTTLPRVLGNSDSFPMPSKAALTGLSVPQRIVAIAESQVGYSTEPSNSYCNKFSAYWNAGTGNCPTGEKSEEWCADFAAWAWQLAGVTFTYGYGPGEINGGAVSFYEWAVANGEWHPATSGYVAAPGDVAVYGLSLGADPSAAHVAIVTQDAPGQQGPDVVNGDGNRTGFSVVETGTNQVYADTGDGDSSLTGYVSPP